MEAQQAPEKHIAETGPILGLALSGGGFRASFFHLGVLARMAELGLLRKVEVLSTVSGGSIVGALYYIRVKRLLESVVDPQVPSYVNEVKEVEKHLFAAVRRNPRARIFLNLFKNLRMAIPSAYMTIGGRHFGWGHYSRTDRMGDLLDLYLYKPAWGERRAKRRLVLDTQIAMHELLIRPPGTDSFYPPRDNPHRDTKVPVLLLNATSLNTGHNWRFEAIRMGESVPDDTETKNIVADIQKNERLAPGYYHGSEDPPSSPITKRQQDFPLGLAVAASAAVPGVFHPLAITGLYDGIKVELVDGGVHDNQGIQGLFDRGCSHLIVSDASGQMSDEPRPGPRILPVLKRSSDVYGTRVRQEQLVRAEKDNERPLALMHLRKGLAPEVKEPFADDGGPVSEAPTTASETWRFHVDAEMQERLAEIRTDLDAFGETEARSLVLDGYRMADAVLADDPAFAQYRSGDAAPLDLDLWGLSEVARLIAPDPAPPRPRWFEQSLAIGRNVLLKSILWWRFSKPVMYGVAAAALGWLIFSIVHWPDVYADALGSGWTVVVIGCLAALALMYLVDLPLLRWISPVVLGICVTAVMAPVLVLLSVAMLIDGWAYRKLGRLRPVPQEAPEGVATQPD